MRVCRTHTLFVIAMAALIVAGVSNVAFAGPGRGKGRGGHGRHGPGGLLNPKRIDRLAEKLQIDDSTLARIKERVFEGHKAGIAMHAELKVARLELHRLLDQDNPDKNEVMQQIERIGVLATEQRKHRVGLLLEVRAMLTPEQRTKLKRLKPFKERRQRRGRRGHDGEEMSGFEPMDDLPESPDL